MKFPHKTLAAIGFAAVMMVGYLAFAGDKDDRGFGPYGATPPVDWSDFDDTAESLNNYLQQNYAAAQKWCHQPTPHPAPGEVLIWYHYDKSGNCIADLAVGPAAHPPAQPPQNIEPAAGGAPPTPDPTD
jgi:hypothetical protein